MSLHLEFEPHSWYKEFAIKNNWTQGHDQSHLERPLKSGEGFKWSAYTANGNTGYIDELHADTLRELKQKITAYHARIAERNAYNRRMIGEI